MRIMLTDGSDTSTQVAELLRDEDHEVFDRCLPDPDAPHTCRGLAGHDCPLDAGADLAITALEHPVDAPAAGIVCARRAAVPVVALGHHDLAHPDLTAALARVAALGDGHVTDLVRGALARTCEQLGIPGGDVVVHHDAEVERIVATVPGPLDGRTRSKLAVRLLDAATASGRGGPRRDVAVVVAP